MRIEKKTRPDAYRQGRGRKDEEIITDWRPFIAYYAILALILFYGIGCFCRDMGVFV